MPRTADTPEVVLSKRHAILDAAESLLIQSGRVESISFRSLAKILKCSYATPYRYFASREELLIALKARAFRWMESELRKARGASASADDQLSAIAESYIHAALSHPSFYTLMFFEIDGVADTNSSKELLLAKHDCLNVCTEAVRAAQTQGLVAAQADALTVSHVFWAGAHGLVSLQIGGQLVMGRDLDALIPSMIATLKTGASNAHLNHFIYSRNQP